MNKFLSKANDFLAKQVPEQRIYMRSDNSTRYVRLSPVFQTVLGSAIAVSFCWTIIASSALLINHISAQSEKTQSSVLQEAYQERLAELSLERDQRANEAKTAQERFYVALEQISTQQSKLLEAEEERRELATGIKIMQRKLQSSVKERDMAQQNSDQLLQELQSVTGSLSTGQGHATDLDNTLSFVSEALEKTVQERDAMKQETEEMKQRVANLEFDARLLQERGEQIFAKLEDAVDVSLTPLSRALNRNGINTESLLNEVRRGYSGTGGPLTPLTVSTGSVFSDKMSDRASKLLRDLDRVNLMKLAAKKLPLGMPVSGNYRNTSGFGWRRDPKTGGRRMHNGADMAGPRGTPIVAPGDGVVTFAGRQSGFGNLIKIRHAQGFETYFAHLNKIRVKNGQKVSRGDRIGDMGTTGRSTGVHLHYEIRINGNPVNPRTYMKAANDVF